MIRISNLTVPLDYDNKVLKRLAEKALGVHNGVISVSIAKKSVDARKKTDVHFVMSLDVTVHGDENALLAHLPARVQAQIVKQHDVFRIPGEARFESRPVVVGLGPAGLLAAWFLAKHGARPVVIERGYDVVRRAQAVKSFFQSGRLNSRSNIQFGEGGAGAFSDGKLTTGISDPRLNAVLRLFYECGAPEEILYQAKPHIGTDKLPDVVRHIREQIVTMGGEVFFETRLTDIECVDGRICGAVIEQADGTVKSVPTDAIILAIGHSARDTFDMLSAAHVVMASKPFAIGVRIEHLQREINISQYGSFASHPALGAADYKLSVHLPNGRSAYTFCMCPGGTVVAATSEPGCVVTNGMSAFARDGVNSNSGLLVNVTPDDFGSDDPLSGIRFQRQWENAAFTLGGEGYKAPAQRVGDFLREAKGSGAGDVEPTYPLGVVYTDLKKCLPGFVTESLKMAVTRMDTLLRGFASPGAVITGVETRSSSPVRIQRDEDCQSSIRGLYPCGEGAGYAGGIMSAAVDGLKCAAAVLKSHGAEV